MRLNMSLTRTVYDRDPSVAEVVAWLREQGEGSYMTDEGEGVHIEGTNGDRYYVIPLADEDVPA